MQHATLARSPRSELSWRCPDRNADTVGVACKAKSCVCVCACVCICVCVHVWFHCSLSFVECTCEINRNGATGSST
jgi:hypothetical protein